MEDIKATFLAAYDANSDALFRYGLYKVSDRELAKDLLQETFMKTWEYVAKGKDVRNVKSFLYKTLNNLVIDHYRRKKSVSLDAMEDDGFEASTDDSERMISQLDGKKAVALLSALEQPYRDAVYLRYIEELSIGEIAAITGDAENTVAVHIHRGVKKLKSLYE